ncbi:hypothetical protein EZZ81_24020 [Pseudomonas viridiflava]|uniref:Uncharacterized protein n=1 Tax=Pseudomonas viridiflava TaxID=33069 RepID=A0AA46W1U9_PSEVI|nr:hypothetical protein EZZ81_24020 [Pseudomonas viridiflava]
MIVPTLQRGNASQDAPRPLFNVAQSVTGGIPTQSVGTISVKAGLCITPGAAPRPDSQTSWSCMIHSIPTAAVGLDQKMCYIPRPRFFQRANVGPEHASSQAVI